MDSSVFISFVQLEPDIEIYETIKPIIQNSRGRKGFFLLKDWQDISYLKTYRARSVSRRSLRRHDGA